MMGPKAQPTEPPDLSRKDEQQLSEAQEEAAPAGRTAGYGCPGLGAGAESRPPRLAASALSTLHSPPVPRADPCHGGGRGSARSWMHTCFLEAEGRTQAGEGRPPVTFQLGNV